MNEALRVVVLASDSADFARVSSACAATGNRAVGYAFAGSARPRQPMAASAKTAVAVLLDELPTGMDVLLLGSTDGLARALPGYRPDLVVCSGFPWRIPPAVLRIPRLGIINIHPSLLPKYRGPFPIPWAIRNGDAHVGVTLHWMDVDFDTGAILVQEGGIALDDEITPSQLHDRIGAVVVRLLPIALDRARAGFPGRPQHAVDASHAGRMEPEFFRVDWSRPAAEIHRQVRAASFLPGCAGLVAVVDGVTVRVRGTRLSPGAGVRVSAGDGPIWITDATPVPSAAK
jgi:methionyl-tRNA formyltransferase